jgi:hypothetical protein
MTVIQPVLPLHECADPAVAKSIATESTVEPLYSVAAESTIKALQSVADSVADGTALTETS